MAEWAKDNNNDWHIINVQCKKVDGEEIKPDIFYKLESGNFIEVSEDKNK